MRDEEQRSTRKGQAREAASHVRSQCMCVVLVLLTLSFALSLILVVIFYGEKLTRPKKISYFCRFHIAFL